VTLLLDPVVLKIQKETDAVVPRLVEFAHSLARGVVMIERHDGGTHAESALVRIGQPAVQQHDGDIGILELPDEIPPYLRLPRGWTTIQALGWGEYDSIQAMSSVDERAQDLLLASDVLSMGA
jgi:hypothetical protein